ncbi:MAG: signal peptidase II [Deltaproteobacteria bacterium RBG_13_49_15]|nr:MAG: signal peptidase II [Deltaproteobacteria bacterium RBG_13_49_15]
MKTVQSRWLFMAAVSSSVVIMDQVSKALIRFHLSLYHSIPVIDGFFNIVHIQNPGGAFGFMAGHHFGLKPVFFLAGAGIAVCLLLYLYQKVPAGNRLLSFGISLILGGAFGNMIDRIRFGRVVDFLDVYVGNLHWPAFNVADSAVTIGGGILVIQMLLKKMPDF